jgi:hypothetical protein
MHSISVCSYAVVGVHRSINWIVCVGRGGVDRSIDQAHSPTPPSSLPIPHVHTHPQVVCEGAGFRPRQFEFNPHVTEDPQDSATLVFGTIKGEVVVARVPEPDSAAHGEWKAGGRRDDTPAAGAAGGGGGGGGRGVGPRRHSDVVASFLEKPNFLGKHKHDSILGCVRGAGEMDG